MSIIVLRMVSCADSPKLRVVLKVLAISQMSGNLNGRRLRTLWCIEISQTNLAEGSLPEDIYFYEP